MSTAALAEFLLARIAEDESMLGEGVYSEARLYAQTEPERWRAEVEAKRRLVELHRSYGGYGEYCNECDKDDPPSSDGWPCDTLKLLALPYADHPDYRQEWKP